MCQAPRVPRKIRQHEPSRIAWLAGDRDKHTQCHVLRSMMGECVTQTGAGAQPEQETA